MNVSLTPELEKLVNKKVQSGMYSSASEVVREALRLLKEQEELRRRRLEELRREVGIGLEQANRGEGAPLDIAKIKSRLRKRLQRNSSAGQEKRMKAKKARTLRASLTRTGQKRESTIPSQHSSLPR